MDGDGDEAAALADIISLPGLDMAERLVFSLELSFSV